MWETGWYVGPNVWQMMLSFPWQKPNVKRWSNTINLHSDIQWVFSPHPSKVEIRALRIWKTQTLSKSLLAPPANGIHLFERGTPVKPFFFLLSTKVKYLNWLWNVQKQLGEVNEEVSLLKSGVAICYICKPKWTSCEDEGGFPSRNVFSDICGFCWLLLFFM